MYNPIVKSAVTLFTFVFPFVVIINHISSGASNANWQSIVAIAAIICMTIGAMTYIQDEDYAYICYAVSFVLNLIIVLGSVLIPVLRTLLCSC